MQTATDLESHPRIGASWEGFILNSLIEHLGVSSEQCYFWGTHTGAELDLLVIHGRHRYGFEIKRMTAPRVTPSMRSALEDLQLTRLDVIHAGTETYRLPHGIRALAATDLLEALKPLRR